MSETVELLINGRPVRVTSGATVATALLNVGERVFAGRKLLLVDFDGLKRRTGPQCRQASGGDIRTVAEIDVVEL